MSKIELVCWSKYVSMRDGVRLAVSIWCGKEAQGNGARRPAVMITTRYWRAMAFEVDKPEPQSFYSLASFLWGRGYVLVTVDARGTGASFGSRECEISSDEVADIGEMIDWIACQGWCDGRVATNGRSYTANTMLHSLSSGTSALKLGIGRAPDFDIYRHLLAPGGIINRWFVDVWGALTAAQDSNDVGALREYGYLNASDETADNIIGIRPVDEDSSGKQLEIAVAEHKGNFNLGGTSEKLKFIDSRFSGCDSQVNSETVLGPYFYVGSNAYFYQHEIQEGNVPIVIRCGWHDAATALGALSMFTSFSNPMRIILGPWNHRCDFRVDPFQPGDGMQPEAIPGEYEFELIADSLDATFNNDPLSPSDSLTSNAAIDDQFGVVEYYTLGENQWKTTKVWPLPETQMRRLYLSADHQLSNVAPEQETACDIYQVDPATTTGINNRWGCQMSEPVFFYDRREDDLKLLVYDTPQLEMDVKITGHPLVHLFVRSTAVDGQFFAYLEAVDPDGRVRLLTDGQLRALHRKVSDETPPYKMFGPYHSLKEKDAEPLTPGEVARITFDLLPISVLLKKGQRIRLAIAGADCDVFDPIPDCESPQITVERNRIYASCIDLPFV